MGKAVGKWLPPGKVTEPAGDQLKEFGIESVPGARVTMTDPAVSVAQRRFFGAALQRKREGRSRTGDPDLSEADLEDFATTEEEGLPERKRRRKK